MNRLYVGVPKIKAGNYCPRSQYSGVYTQVLIHTGIVRQRRMYIIWSNYIYLNAQSTGYNSKSNTAHNYVTSMICLRWCERESERWRKGNELGMLHVLESQTGLLDYCFGRGVYYFCRTNRIAEPSIRAIKPAHLGEIAAAQGMGEDLASPVSMVTKAPEVINGCSNEPHTQTQRRLERNMDCEKHKGKEDLWFVFRTENHMAHCIWDSDYFKYVGLDR